ncbi:MAG: dTDP-4-dehydrorhamnose 3,5-epimerase [Acidobacteria bacterium]|nr:dTDP-4-dehydrorhamnose 3,5-epimerase [Acidobacteriota bacterium]MCB9398119.1 dTDP-4-dehydrorhamnose 3,5-epimerase [Acidobacteriota bacterium]
MEVVEFKIPGLVLLKPKVFRDDRGYFLEAYNQRIYHQLGIKCDFVQNNQSYSTRGVLRGLHYQVNRPQAKLVQVVQGSVWDVAVDIRPNSPTFGQWEAVHLDAAEPSLFFIPEGCAHGFQVLSDAALFAYQCSDFYSPPDDRGLLWSDPALNIPWPIAPPILSPKDTVHPRLEHLDPNERRTRD